MQPHRVAVLAFDRISPFHLSVPCLVFGESLPGECNYQLVVCAAEPGRLTTTAGFELHVEQGLEALLDAQTIIVPSWHNPDQHPSQALLDALVAAHERGAHLVGLCLGAFVLAEAGLLDGRPATTHWAWARVFAERFPAVRLDSDVLYVDDDNLLTSAGTAAGIDCCLYLLRQHCGAKVANKVARRLVVPPHRQGGQAQFIEQPLPATARDDRLSDLLDWVRGNLDQPHSLDSLADKVLMSRRSFTRHFRQLTGTSVGDWLLAERLALSQRLLESTDQPIDSIAELAGFGSPVSLRHHFGRSFAVSPSSYRQSFRGR
ncbi:AraC family transcriptional regulator [Pseudomonas taeanensis MS-3]|jgi:transcriptional regulator GlxA family with amidase domain|uniref:AraC family transcriptional regulator n=1 Tax=Pseudomonas taeanensis MS-3 TaxID=1395571 RepID=A0A0A1YHW3_9PSED|nr:helix-turn-helix domain-containing protein [Pseudomonas taeanensis]KFX69460.1 AraC family transcriptional regulator [Pseudomonas taeanensis MS-3]